MEKPSLMTCGHALADPRADILANARNIIMKTRASIGCLAQAPSRRGPDDGVLSPRRARRRSGTR